MPLIIDSSAIIPLAMDDEDARYAHVVLDALVNDTAMAPILFWFEIRNVLIVNERRGRVGIEKVMEFLEELSILPIMIDPLPDNDSLLKLSRKHQLTVYDAAYLELAIREGGMLASLDDALLKAAAIEGVNILTSNT